MTNPDTQVLSFRQFFKIWPISLHKQLKYLEKLNTMTNITQEQRYKSFLLYLGSYIEKTEITVSAKNNLK